MSYFHNASLREQLYGYIKKKINSGELKAGCLINQKEIFDELNISRTPYRDCMIQLESEGLVKIIPCKGVVVRELSLEEVMEIQELAGALEGLAYELAFYNARVRCIPEMKEMLLRAAWHFDNNKPIPQDLNNRFHMIVIEQCPNGSIVNQLVRLRERIYDFPQRSLPALLKWEKIFWEEHKVQIDILENGTPLDLGEYTRRVHWNVEGKEEYWERLLGVKAAAVRQYFRTRKPYADTAVVK